MASRRDSAADGGFRDDPSVPDLGDQFVLVDDALAMAYEILKKVEDLRLEADKFAAAAQLAPVAIERMVVEDVDQAVGCLVAVVRERAVREISGKNQG